MSLADKIAAVVTAIGAELKAKVDKADLADVATSGSYDDLDDKPTLGTAAATDATDYATATQGTAATNALEGVQWLGNAFVEFTESLPAVATSGSYNDLDDKPSIPAPVTALTDLDTTVTGAQLNADHAKLTGVAEEATKNATDAQLRARSSHTGTQSAATITGLADVATSGSYDDLDDKPTIPPALPSQTGNAGKVLGTNGTSPSWVTPSGGGGASENPVPIAANYSAAVGDFVVPMVDGLTVTLPPSADHGDMVQVFSVDFAVTVDYFNLFTQVVNAQTLTPETLGTFRYIEDVDVGAGPMSGWYLTRRSETPDVMVNPRFVLLSETEWGATTPEADRTYLVFED
ncbi:hypothetical protein [Mycolicibacter algericus]|uniref:Uncharacterized protein n=2 Tax=Mycolicibacter algericus TaxID=1288388 RepID=A0A7I9Y412_MYCAL|nr:hypothetical protein [Mycolicibacter algericus]OQZ94312.1 hypothetical protein BST10_18740 [Mycolicibacter algericus DSM 45454]GFG83400.1 hypothetical protein MALGJ_00760 [Mycolicibacter algericus]